MIENADFFKKLTDLDVKFFAGVPDSLLKNFCFYLSDHLPQNKHIIAANEGSAISLACGYHLATGKTPMVYMQNSGLGNAINPLLSLADSKVYSIPMLLLIGWRGEPGVKDEPQHVKQGQVMLASLDSMEIPYFILDAESDPDKILSAATKQAVDSSAPVALVVRKNTFASYTLQNGEKHNYSMTREEALNKVLEQISENDVVVSTTGKTSRELYELRIKREENNRSDFLVVGSMGHASQIALGLALEKPQKKVFCLDGDGSALMHAGGLATIPRCGAKNFVHVMINNGAHESVGGQSTGAFDVDWQNLIRAFGYKKSAVVTKLAEIEDSLKTLAASEGPVFLEIRTQQGSRKDLGRPKSTPIENKKRLMKNLKNDV